MNGKMSSVNSMCMQTRLERRQRERPDQTFILNWAVCVSCVTSIEFQFSNWYNAPSHTIQSISMSSFDRVGLLSQLPKNSVLLLCAHMCPFFSLYLIVVVPPLILCCCCFAYWKLNQLLCGMCRDALTMVHPPPGNVPTIRPIRVLYMATINGTDWMPIVQGSSIPDDWCCIGHGVSVVCYHSAGKILLLLHWTRQTVKREIERESRTPNGRVECVWIVSVLANKLDHQTMVSFVRSIIQPMSLFIMKFAAYRFSGSGCVCFTRQRPLIWFCVYCTYYCYTTDCMYPNCYSQFAGKLAMI